MKLPPRARTFNFPPRGLAHPPRVQPSRRPALSLPPRAHNRRLPFPPFRLRLRRFRKAPTLFPPLVTSDTNAGKQASGFALFFFLAAFFFYRSPPMPPFALGPFVILTYRRCCWFAVRYGAGIKRVDQPRSSSSFFLNTQIDGDASFSG